VFGQVDLITVREEQSRNLLSEIGLFHPKLFVTDDVVYLLKPADRQRILEIAKIEELDYGFSPKIAVCLCSYEKTQPNRLRSIASFCDYAVSRFGAQIWFIPMQTSVEHDDREEAKAVLSLMQNRDSARCINGEYSPREILGLIGETHAVLAERLHGSIMAINANIPCFGIGYSPKVTWLFDKIGYPQHHILSKDLSPNRLVTDFSLFWEKRERVRHDLKAIGMRLKSAAMDNFHHFKRDLVTDYGKSA
jgi:polysaccharide pyruvyl transferase WcaK-like protein